jgi:hypothetical protein
MRERVPGGGPGLNFLLIAILLALIAGLAAWAFSSSDPASPVPQETALPDAVPGAGPPIG